MGCPVNRKGLGLGRGKGYLNLIPRDCYVHSMSAKGIKVTMVSSKVLGDFAGMNNFASKQLHFHPRPKKNEVFIDRDMSKTDKAKTLLHEMTEMDLMRQGHPYWSAHKEALKSEKLIHAKEIDPYKFQDTHQEKIIHDHENWKKGNSYRYILEKTGDIFRSLAEDKNPNYIMEKINGIKNHINDYNNHPDWKSIEEETKYLTEEYGISPIETNIHPADSYEYSYRENKICFEKMKKLWKKQPVKDEWQEKAVELNLAMLDKKYDTALRLMDEIEKHVRPEENKEQ